MSVPEVDQRILPGGSIVLFGRLNRLDGLRDSIVLTSEGLNIAITFPAQIPPAGQFELLCLARTLIQATIDELDPDSPPLDEGPPTTQS